MSTGGSIFRGVFRGVTGVEVDDIDGDGDFEDGFELEEGDIEIDEEQFQEFIGQSRIYAENIYNQWIVLSAEEQNTSNPEEFAKGWLERNLDTMSDSTLTIIAGIIGGAIVGVITGDSSNIDSAVNKIG